MDVAVGRVTVGKAALVLAVAAALCAVCGAASAAGLLPLTGEMRVATCSGPCALPAPDDPRWSAIPLGPAGISSSLNQQEGLAWVRVRFALPAGAVPERPALLVTHPADADEVFLNGAPAGGTGSIGPHFATAVAGPRVVPLPAAALREGTNELVFHALFAGRNARFYTGPFLLGELAEVTAEASRAQLPIVATEAAFFSMFVSVLLDRKSVV
jgi:hypothetical protein